MTFERLLGCLEQVLPGAYHSQVGQQEILKIVETLRRLPGRVVK